MINELKFDNDNSEEDYDKFGNKLNPNLKNMSEEELQKLVDDVQRINQKLKEHSEKWGWGL